MKKIILLIAVMFTALNATAQKFPFGMHQNISKDEVIEILKDKGVNCTINPQVNNYYMMDLPEFAGSKLSAAWFEVDTDNIVRSFVFFYGKDSFTYDSLFLSLSAKYPMDDKTEGLKQRAVSNTKPINVFLTNQDKFIMIMYRDEVYDARMLHEKNEKLKKEI